MVSTAYDTLESRTLNESRIRCLLVGSTDPLTRNLRSGVALRYRNPPAGVKYELNLERLGYPAYLGYYSLKPLTTPLSMARLFAEAAFPVGEKSYSLVHSFYWSLRRYSIPWIHENDQSLGQLLTGYVKLNGFPQRRIVEFTSTLLNSKKCRAVIVWSQWAKKGYCDDGVDRLKMRVIPPPFPIINDRKRHDQLNILFLGRDYKRKGGDIALTVFNELQREFRDIRLTYIGKIRDPVTLKNALQNSSISYHESVSQHFLISEVFPVTDIFLLPCRAEAFGMSIVEALSRGIPVISSNISAIPEIVDGGTTGYLNDPDDVQGFVSSVARIAQDENLRKAMYESTRRSVSEKYSPYKISQRLLKTYLDSMV